MSYEAGARVRTCLWFADEAEEVARHYVTLLPDSRIESMIRPDPDGPALVVEFTLNGAPYMTLNGGPKFTHSPAASISVLTSGQAETDRLWDALLADGGEEGMCGWVTDRYGVSWQVVPDVMPKFFSSSDREAADRAMTAMMQMRKIDIVTVERAFRGN
jgi:predicted 3-demethylubiquinone-9 3-methyltransferase (glyoxalase superfamily)